VPRLAAVAYALAALAGAVVMGLLPRSSWSWLYLPFQAGLHEGFLPVLLLGLSLTMGLLAAGRLGRAWYAVGLAACIAGAGEVVFRLALAVSFVPSGALSLLLSVLIGVGLAAGLRRRAALPAGRLSTGLAVLAGGYFFLAMGLYPLAWVVGRFTIERIPLSSLTPAPPREPIRRVVHGQEMGVYFGELHGHSFLSVDARLYGASSPRHYYEYARDIAGLDFAALTDHDSPNGVGDNPHLWRHVCRLADEYYEPGRFVTFKAFEWTSGEGHYELFRHLLGIGRDVWDDSEHSWGHRNVYFLGDVPEVAFQHDDPAADTPEELWALMQQYEAIAIPHHPLGGPVPAFRWEHYSEAHEPIVELYSSHGNSEAADAPHVIYNAYLPEDVGTQHDVQYALSLGYRFGFIGSTDSHSGWGGNDTTRPDASRTELMPTRLREHYGQPAIPGGGLAGVYATELTREGLWEALKAKRTFATTGERMVVALEGEGGFMGEVVTAQGPIELELRAEGTAAILLTEILRNGEVVLSQPGAHGSADIEIAWTDPAPLPGEAWYYARVTQEGQEMAWTSPLWVTPAPRE
jgi:hypothetical protein